MDPAEHFADRWEAVRRRRKRRARLARPLCWLVLAAGILGWLLWNLSRLAPG